jgi:metal-sulfur cluster biosynthetic enzyme
MRFRMATRWQPPTAPGCPIHDVMVDWVRRVVLEIPSVEQVEKILTFDPP